MGFILSCVGIWKDKLNLMIRYVITFVVFSLQFLYLILKTNVIDRAIGTNLLKPLHLHQLPITFHPVFLIPPTSLSHRKIYQF